MFLLRKTKSKSIYYSKDGYKWTKKTNIYKLKRYSRFKNKTNRKANVTKGQINPRQPHINENFKMGRVGGGETRDTDDIHFIL